MKRKNNKKLVCSVSNSGFDGVRLVSRIQGKIKNE